MKSLLILVTSSLFVGCATVTKGLPFPQKIKYHYVVEVREGVSCLKFNIVSANPYQKKFAGRVPLSECNGMSGYKLEDVRDFIRWVNEVQNPPVAKEPKPFFWKI